MIQYEDDLKEKQVAEAVVEESQNGEATDEGSKWSILIKAKLGVEHQRHC